MAKFVVNPGGAVHSVPDEWVQDLLQRGFRLATEDEIRAWYAMQGLEMPEVGNDADEHGAADQPGEKPNRRSSRR